MKKNTVIIILLFLITLLGFYGYVKSEEAWNNRKAAEKQFKLTEQRTEEAIAAQERANEYQKALEECQSK